MYNGKWCTTRWRTKNRSLTPLSGRSLMILYWLTWLEKPCARWMKARHICICSWLSKHKLRCEAFFERPIWVSLMLYMLPKESAELIDVTLKFLRSWKKVRASPDSSVTWLLRSTSWSSRTLIVNCWSLSSVHLRKILKLYWSSAGSWALILD